jgi:hypothetical protein
VSKLLPSIFELFSLPFFTLSDAHHHVCQVQIGFISFAWASKRTMTNTTTNTSELPLNL